MLGKLTGFISRKKEDDVSEAYLEEETEAYFDEKLGKWVFKGEDPEAEEEVKAPPTIE